ncbi:hypothetical protein [Mycobacterium asiaticum]|uniref:hypothetical protein n=1 Tax=Mycobacterium asiaticum TaxID=1790 RepID=UPI000AA9DEF4|nr:hypothetical protein [Mycobacterium asiaticum]
MASRKVWTVTCFFCERNVPVWQSRRTVQGNTYGPCCAELGRKGHKPHRLFARWR